MQPLDPCCCASVPPGWLRVCANDGTTASALPSIRAETAMAIRDFIGVSPPVFPTSLFALRRVLNGTLCAAFPMEGLGAFRRSLSIGNPGTQQAEGWLFEKCRSVRRLGAGGTGLTGGPAPVQSISRSGGGERQNRHD